MFRYSPVGVVVGRADGARVWGVLSELTDVPVTVQWERPARRVYWRDGPTQRVLMDRAAALGGYRVGAPLDLRAVAVPPRRLRDGGRVGLAGAGESGLPARGHESGVEGGGVLCEDTGYPQGRFDEATLAAADLVAAPGPELTGRVTI